MSNFTVDMEAISCSKLFKTSSRRNEIYVKASSLANSSSSLKIQPDYMINVSDSFSSKVDHSDGTKRVVRNPDIKQANAYSENNRELHDSELNDSESTDDSIKDRAHASGNDSLHDSSSTELQDSTSKEDGAQELNAAKIESMEHVSAASGTSLPRTDVTDSMNLEVEDIKSLLNSDSTTSGVLRVHCAGDNELWVRYEDSINLNDVMVPAIEMLNRPGYTYLQFNRLARSENSIVFVILKNDTDREKKPESEIKEQSTKEQ